MTTSARCSNVPGGHSYQFQRGRQRRNSAGTAAVECALVLPLIMFIFAVGADWCRIYYVAQTLDECARSGALAGSGVAYQERNLSDSAREARAKSEATKDSATLDPALQASQVTATTSGNFITVTVTYPFTTVLSFPIVGGTWNVSRSVRMPIQP